MRVIGPNGEQLGVMGVRDALVKAAEAELDLVEVAPTSVPPVCRIIDYGKYKYEQQKKSRGSHRRTSDIKGMRFSPKIGEHDFQVKARHVYEFLHESGLQPGALHHAGLPDRFVTHGSMAQLLDEVGLSAAELVARVRAWVKGRA